MKQDIEITIDGSQGEGGGQILRSALALSVITGKSLRLTKIRAGRKKPGLMRQHLTCVQAAASISAAEVEGAEPGASDITFMPQAVLPGNYHFRIGTAGSAMLVLQTVLPALLRTTRPSTLTLEGGTHNMQAPPFDFLNRSWLPLIERFGPSVTARLERHGFYPAGGGRVVVEITPSQHLAGFDLLEAGRVQDRRVRALVSNLSADIGDREVHRAVRKLNWPSESGEVCMVESNGPGNVLYAEIHCENITTMCCGFGRVGVRAEQVADGVVRGIRSWLKQAAPVGPFLADQLMLPMALSAAQVVDCEVQRGGKFRTGPLTEHARTQMDILPLFLNVDITAQCDDSGALLEIVPGGRSTS
jgi:RNA 3'-terminal phosphate cyclase (ATP)